MKQSILGWDEMIYDDCARGLFCPDESEMADMGPLPPEKHTAADYDALEVREMLTGMADDLKTLFQRGETLNRFSAEYADLCPRMMEVLRMAGSALSTLYVNGDDVNTAAVSILELRRLASFHFRKCQQAARVAAGRNEPVYLRTANLELQWAKLLLRLKQTEIRFSRPLPKPKAEPAVEVHASEKPLQLESSAGPAAEPSRTLPQVRAIPAAMPFRAPRPASPQPSMPPVQLHQQEAVSLPQQHAEEESAIEPDAEELQMLQDFMEVQTYHESCDLRVLRDTRLSDLFVPYGPDPDSG